ncbi:MAG: TatD family hydrolase [Comamonas sp.]|jgi:TatD DNase family protein|uniref:TatD family hydrolase n=1 Tax=Comamonas sp. TaxID=34028 RepID=UPI00282E2397|nr:TatD family hydrolase [Comamonas sp.]MDR0216319.1 TatD family hydrolase [Comamonas sp.]MDR2299164.1 TatD family hydrolase [Comamonas sp.]
MPCWIDTHCHLDAAEFAPDRDDVRAAARAAGVGHLLIPAVERSHWQEVLELAHRHGDSYALGIHPLYTPRADESDIGALRDLLTRQRADPHLVAVGEIGLDFFVPGLDAQRQIWFYEQQIRLAREFELPVILHVRKSSDRLLKTLRTHKVVGGIAHAFNGSAQQAQAFIDLGFKLGFGGAVTYDRALKLRELAAGLPLQSLVLETDAPDIPPHWLYTTAEQRATGMSQGRNSPAELPRIAAQVAQLRGISVDALAEASTANARQVLGLPMLHQA